MRPPSVRRVLPVAACVLVAGCGATKPHAAVPPSPMSVVTGVTGDEGYPATIPSARRLTDGRVQVVVEGGACEWLSGFTQKAHGAKVTVRAYTGREDGVCTMQIVPWLVPLTTKVPEDAVLIDGSTGDEIVLIDCRKPAEPDDRFCRLSTT